MNVDEHRILINEETRELTIMRMMQDGSEHLYTSTPLPEVTGPKNISNFEEFARQLGENILLDSPIARKLLNL